jgi:hypothetical protein
MDVRSASTDSQVWQGTGLRAVEATGDLILIATVSADAVPDGSYVVAIQGVRAGGAPAASEDLGFVPIKVVRVP